MLRAIFSLFCRESHWFGLLDLPGSNTTRMPRGARHSGVRCQQRAALKRRRQKRSRR